MTDPATGLESFQQEFLQGTIQLKRGVLDSDLHAHFDKPDGENRLTYVRLEGKIVTAFVNFVSSERIEGTPCFGIGYAVPEAYRNQGRAKEVIRAALAEMQHGFGKYGHSVFYVEAIVGADNKPSQRVAEQTISDTPVAVTDQISGLPAFQYLRKMEQPQVK